MKKIIVIMAILGALTFGGLQLLNGQVIPMHEGGTLDVIQSAINANGITMIWAKDDCYAFFKANSSMRVWSSVFIDISNLKSMTALQAAQLTGQAMSGASTNEFTKLLEESGWHRIGPGAVPVVLRAALKTAEFTRMMSTISPTLLVLPVAVFPTPIVGVDG